jgi:hypothetical protein
MGLTSQNFSGYFILDHHFFSLEAKIKKFWAKLKNSLLFIVPQEKKKKKKASLFV